MTVPSVLACTPCSCKRRRSQSSSLKPNSQLRQSTACNLMALPVARAARCCLAELVSIRDSVSVSATTQKAVSQVARPVTDSSDEHAQELEQLVVVKLRQSERTLAADADRVGQTGS